MKPWKGGGFSRRVGPGRLGLRLAGTDSGPQGRPLAPQRAGPSLGEHAALYLSVVTAGTVQRGGPHPSFRLQVPPGTCFPGSSCSAALGAQSPGKGQVIPGSTGPVLAGDKGEQSEGGGAQPDGSSLAHLAPCTPAGPQALGMNLRPPPAHPPAMRTPARRSPGPSTCAPRLAGPPKAQDAPHWCFRPTLLHQLRKPLSLPHHHPTAAPQELPSPKRGLTRSSPGSWRLAPFRPRAAHQTEGSGLA